MVKKVFSRACLPLPVNSGFFVVWDGPVCLKTAKMIDAQKIGQNQLVTNPGDPPLITAILMGFPIIERISPELAGGGEIVRRNTGDNGWIPVLI